MKGTYGPIPSRKPQGIVGMPFNRTTIKVRGRVGGGWLGATSGACGRCMPRAACALHATPHIPPTTTHSHTPPHTPLTLTQGLYCVGDSTFPGQGVNAVAMSGIGCAHRVSGGRG